MGLAYAEVARTHSLDPLGAYLALRDLGIQQGLPDYRAAHLYNSLGERSQLGFARVMVESPLPQGMGREKYRSRRFLGRPKAGST